eukprot:1242682-Prymnesium_polylepis.3
MGIIPVRCAGVRDEFKNIRVCEMEVRVCEISSKKHGSARWADDLAHPFGCHSDREVEIKSKSDINLEGTSRRS